ncbi:L,D-transpeptidase family protein [Clostridium grantii]|uniref:Putative cell wall binding repeat-containing protein n=1 Tax=Clostridium grantii DSM 8605 TaxID=1121316 RepID=A0A1M5RKB2_9CLOT|nr:L,D-transpeptidase family protein [Clostridium grantii]SHH26694.1 Putative cell wall binding repeat-containing protein [Clostridium grantii DSM 8605]
MINKKCVSMFLITLILVGSTNFLTTNAEGLNGWNESQGDWYYYSEGVMKTQAWVEDSEQRWYYVDNQGIMKSNSWVQDSLGKWYYLDGQGVMKANSWFQYSSGKWCYLGKDGVMETNTWVQDSSGIWYYLDGNGEIKANGWAQDSGGKWYYLNKDGLIKTNEWIQDSNNRRYYLDSAGIMKTGWFTYENKQYYFNSKGVMTNGWIDYQGKWYYLNSNGSLATGWIESASVWYYIAENGELLTNESFERIINTKDLSSSTSYLITIDEEKQMVNIFEGFTNNWKIIKSIRCATGKKSTPTVKGFYIIESKGAMFRVSSNTICKYYTGFYGNYLFHTVLLDNAGNVQVGTLGQAVSHGCVRLSIEDAKYIYDNIPYYTKVWSY